MKWGRRKSSSASSFSSSAAAHASPFSWLSKFKQMRINSEPSHGRMKHSPKQNSKSVGSPQNSCGNGDALWRARPSFNEENHEDKKSEDIDESIISRRSSMKLGTREDTLKFKEKNIGPRHERKLLNDRKVLIEMEEYNREKEYEQLRRRFERKAQEVLQEQLLKLEREAAEAEFASIKVVQQDELKFDSPRTICTPRAHSFASFADSNSSNFKVRSLVESYEKTGRQYSPKKKSYKRQRLKQTEEVKVKTQKNLQTHDVSREVQRRKPKHSTSSKVRIYSPRMASKVEVCRIKALEDMRKAKLKMKKEREEVVMEETHGSCSDSFAVIRCSLDPKKDFRDSMIEMIMEKQIRDPQEMEELLACYLTLNADEYHDLIIKVFRQVWFDMNQGGFGIKTNMQCSFCE